MMRIIIITLILSPFIIYTLVDSQITRGRQPGTAYTDPYTKLETRTVIGDTADVLRGEWRSDISDSLATQTFLIEPEAQVLTSEAGNTYEVLMHVGQPTTRYAFIDSMSLNANSVRASEIANDAVQTAHILDSTIVGANISAGSISGYHLIDNFEGYGLYMENVDAASQILHIRTDGTTTEINNDTVRIPPTYLTDSVNVYITNRGIALGELLATGTTGHVFKDNGAGASIGTIDSIGLSEDCVYNSELANNAVQTANVLDSTLTSDDFSGDASNFHFLESSTFGAGLYKESIDASTDGIKVLTDNESAQVTNDTVEVNAVYGNFHQGDDPDTVTITNLGEYYTITDYDAEEASHVGTIIENGELILPYTGIYFVNVGFSFGGTAGAIMDMALFVNSVKDSSVSLERKLGASGDIGQASTGNVLSFNANDTLKVRVTSDDNGDIFIFRNSQFAVYMIGK